MSTEIKNKLASLPGVAHVDVDKIDVHGERAIEIVAVLQDGRTVTGTFTTEDKPAFGGVTFYNRKDVSALMASKIGSVIAGRADTK